MFDHVGINVQDYAASRAFYERALAPIGYRVVMAFDEWKAAGLGTDEHKPELWIAQREPYGTGTHLAFTCADRQTVDAFHEAALDAGGIDNGAPGIREEYTPTYYAAYVHDLDGNNVEAVCHSPT
jgi:catechol 2,3-dioxygenase-like lactoylglutathione lyase family enzyme